MINSVFLDQLLSFLCKKMDCSTNFGNCFFGKRASKRAGIVSFLYGTSGNGARCLFEERSTS